MIADTFNDRKIFQIDVGDLPPGQAKKFLEELKDTFKKKETK